MGGLRSQDPQGGAGAGVRRFLRRALPSRLSRQPMAPRLAGRPLGFFGRTVVEPGSRASLSRRAAATVSPERKHHMSNAFVWFHNGSEKPGDAARFYEKL